MNDLKRMQRARERIEEAQQLIGDIDPNVRGEAAALHNIIVAWVRS